MHRDTLSEGLKFHKSQGYAIMQYIKENAAKETDETKRQGMINDFGKGLSDDNIDDSGVHLTEMYKEALANYIQTSANKRQREESKAAFEPKQMTLSEYREQRKKQESQK